MVDDILSVAQASLLFGKDTSWIYRQISKRRLKGGIAAGKWYVDRESARELKAQIDAEQMTASSAA